MQSVPTSSFLLKLSGGGPGDGVRRRDTLALNATFVITAQDAEVALLAPVRVPRVGHFPIENAILATPAHEAHLIRVIRVIRVISLLGSRTACPPTAAPVT